MDGAPIDEQAERLAHGRVGQRGVGCLEARPLAVHFAVGIGEVALDVLDAAGRIDLGSPLAALLQPPQDIVLHLDVPGEVELAGLQHGPGRRGGVPAALHLDRVEERPVGRVVVGVDVAAHDVARPEVDELVGPGADRLEVGRRLPALGALEGLEQMLGDDGAVLAERLVPVRRRLLEDDLDAVLVELLDAIDVAVRADRAGVRRRVGRVLPVEDHVVGGEGLAVVPLHTLLELPDDPGAVLAEPAVVQRGDGRGQRGDEVAVWVVASQRLVEDAGAVPVLGAGREVRVEQRGRLPPQHLELPAAAPLGGREHRRLGLRLHAAGGQHLGGERGGHSHA